MFNRLSSITFSTLIIPNLILLSNCFCIKDAFAAPLKDNLKTLDKTLKPIQIKVNSSHEFVLENHHLTGEIKIANNKFELQETDFQSFCSTFGSPTNTIKPNIPSNNEKDRETPTSYFAEDLMGFVNHKKEKKKSAEPTLFSKESLPKLSEEPPKTEELKPTDDNQWHFKLQPYGTLPINTYGTVSARGETVSYHQTLGELLDSLRVTASGRFKAWNGRWGFIMNGFFASLQNIDDLSIERTRFNRDTRASLQFEQGIYDFAVSYHIGDLPSHELTLLFSYLIICNLYRSLYKPLFFNNS